MPLSSVAGELSLLFAMLYSCDFSQCLMKWAFAISIWSSKHLNHQRLCLLDSNRAPGWQLETLPLFPEGGAVTQVFRFPFPRWLNATRFHFPPLLPERYCCRHHHPSMVQGPLRLQDLDWICDDSDEWDTLWGFLRIFERGPRKVNFIGDWGHSPKIRYWAKIIWELVLTSPCFYPQLLGISENSHLVSFVFNHFLHS